MENNITLADIYNVVIKLDGKFNKLEEDFKSLDKKVSDTKKELITKIEDTKQELITYVDKKVDDAKKARKCIEEAIKAYKERFLRV